MSMRHNLTSLKIFVAVAEFGNLTRAAEHEHLAVSAVSKRVAELERMVGTPLLRRYPHGVGLTPAGQSLRHHAQQILQLIQCMDAELAEYASGVRGHVHIHAMSSATSQFLPEEIECFMTRYPLVDISLENRDGKAIVLAVIEGRADVGIVTSKTPLRGLESIPYRHDALMIGVPLGHPLAKRKTIRFSDALDHAFIVPRAESSLAALMVESAKACGKAIQQRMHVSGADAMCRLVGQGLGIVMLPKGMLSAHVAAGRIQAVELKEAWARWQMLIVVRNQGQLSPAARCLVEHLQRTSADLAA